MGSRTNHTPTGFSLVEVLISLAIMGVALLALVSVLTSGMKAQNKTSKHSIAHAVAEQTLERLAATLRTDSSASDDFWKGRPWALPTELSEVSVDGALFRCSATSRSLQAKGQEFGTLKGDSSNVARLVTLTVAWSEDAIKIEVGAQELSVRRVLSRSEQ